MIQYLLDTNILLAWIRWGTPLQRFLQATYQLDTLSVLPIISAAELRVIALQNEWGAYKTRMMESLLAYLAAVPIPYKTSVDAYVEIDDYSRRLGVKMGKTTSGLRPLPRPRVLSSSRPTKTSPTSRKALSNTFTLTLRAGYD